MSRSDNDEEVSTEWTLTCLDCDFEQELTNDGHPRDGPPDVVQDRVTTHKHATDASHVVRVAGRRAERDETIDPSLVTDGGPEYCAACNRSIACEDRVERAGTVYHRQCAPDDVVENRTFDDLRTDGGFEELNALERQADALEDVAEQMRIQNAALVELIRTLDNRAAEDIGLEEPTSGRSSRSVAGWVEDAALDIEECVDLDSIDRVSEVQR